MSRKAEKTPLQVVQEIHTRVLTSSDQCLAEAKRILQQSDNTNLDLYEEMRKRGFGNAKEIKEKEAQIKEQSLAKQKAELINGYTLRYPHKKFISTEELDKICKDYNLLLGADQHYTGSIPERSMKEIVDFKLQAEDEIYYKGTWRATESLKLDKTKGVIDWKEIDKDQYNKDTDNGKSLVQNNKRTHYISNRDYFIVGAPKGMFEIEGMVQEGNTLKKIVEVDDPFCLKPVRYGYIVVACWGEEMAIEKMQNPKMN